MSAPHLLATLRRRAAGLDRTIVLPEADDPRIQEAALAAVRLQLVRPLLISSGKAPAPEGIDVLAPGDDPRLRHMAENIAASPIARGRSVDRIQEQLLDPLFYACALVRDGRADAAVMGAVATTAATLRAALGVIGVDRRYQVVTSCFLMELPDRVLVYADCGVVPQPTAEQLADIAIQAAESYRSRVGGEPHVALLSFSTHGSARHGMLEPVLNALEILKERGVDFPIDGELQADAALVPAVARRKARDSPVAGRANVLVFPDLNSGNIAYKITERLAGARAVGPLLQGLALPVHDLSRGCSSEDILDTMAIAALDAESMARPDPRRQA
ncbi:MAG: phosphate acetyltransferase [Acidobacteriota bacterium]